MSRPTSRLTFGDPYGYTGNMKATIDVPEPLYRRVKARSALEGRTIREVTIELYERWLVEQPSPASGEAARSAAERWLARWEALGTEIAGRAVDPRTTREILTGDRR